MSGVGSALRRSRLADFSPEQVGFLTFGRGVDTTRMRTVLGFEPAYTTAEAFADFGSTIEPTGGQSVRALDGLAHALVPAEARQLGAGMGDAEIIPIGTRGRPGRGTGKDKPSSAARDLAPRTPRRRRLRPRRRHPRRSRR